MTTQHTSGNWIAFQTENQANVGQWSIGLEHSYHICHGVGKNGAYMLLSGVCSETDARLVAAAPELLEALESIADALANPVSPGHVAYVSKVDLIRRAAAAIAKARGEA